MKRFIFSMATAAVLLAGGTSAMAQTSGRWNPYWEIEGRGGDRQERSQSRTFIPIFQDESSILFSDIRLMYIEGGAWEGNFGVGHRQILSSQRVFGVYGFYDVRDSTDNNTFHQGSVGTELLDINWGLRANAYLPDTSAQSAPGGNAFLQGNQILVQGNQQRAYYGMDVEAEHVIWRDDCTGDTEIWAAAGYFNFDNNATGFQNIAGPRARIEARLYDLPMLGNESRIVASGQYEYDDVRGSVSQGFLSVRIPLGFGGKNRPKPSLLDRRMLTPIVRDIDIVTNIAAGGPIELGMNAKTGVVLDDVVTLTALDDITGDVAAGADERVFILDGIDGPANLMDTVVLNDGQILIGGGGSMNVVGAMSGLEAVFTAGGDAFTINQMDMGENVINLASDNGIYGLTLDGGHDSIFGFNPGTFEIAGNTLMNADDDLIDIFVDDTALGCIIDNTFLANGNEAFEIDVLDGGDFDLTIVGNSFQMTDSDAIIVDVEDDSTLIIDVRNNRFFGQGNDGVEFNVDDNGSVTAMIVNNIFDDVDDNAIEVDANNSSVLDLIIVGNTFLGRDNTEGGVNIDLNHDAELTLLVADNVFDDIDDTAIEIDVNDDAVFDGMIIGNTILGRGNTSRGIDIRADYGGTATTLIEGNIFQDISDDGIFLDVEDDGVMDTTIVNNSFLRILGDGIEVSVEDHDDGVVVQTTQIMNNRFVDVGVDADGLDNGGAAVRIEANDADSDGDGSVLQDTMIAGNTFLRSGTGIILQFDADSDSDTKSYVSVTNIFENKFLNTVTDAISLDVDDLDGEDLSIELNIENNLFRNTGEDAIDLRIDHTHTESGVIPLETLIAGNRFLNTGDTAIRIDVVDEAALDADILDNYIRGAVDGINIFNDGEPAFVTIGGNRIRKITGTGILIDADADITLDDNGQNNRVRVRPGGTIFDIDDDGDVMGTIEINNVDQVFP